MQTGALAIQFVHLNGPYLIGGFRSAIGRPPRLRLTHYHEPGMNDRCTPGIGRLRRAWSGVRSGSNPAIQVTSGLRALSIKLSTIFVVVRQVYTLRNTY